MIISRRGIIQQKNNTPVPPVSNIKIQITNVDCETDVTDSVAVGGDKIAIYGNLTNVDANTVSIGGVNVTTRINRDRVFLLLFNIVTESVEWVFVGSYATSNYEYEVGKDSLNRLVFDGEFFYVTYNESNPTTHHIDKINLVGVKVDTTTFDSPQNKSSLTLGDNFIWAYSVAMGNDPRIIKMDKDLNTLNTTNSFFEHFSYYDYPIQTYAINDTLYAVGTRLPTGSFGYRLRVASINANMGGYSQIYLREDSSTVIAGGFKMVSPTEFIISLSPNRGGMTDGTLFNLDIHGALRTIGGTIFTCRETNHISSMNPLDFTTVLPERSYEALYVHSIASIVPQNIGHYFVGYTEMDFDGNHVGNTNSNIILARFDPVNGNIGSRIVGQGVLDTNYITIPPIGFTDTDSMVLEWSCLVSDLSIPFGDNISASSPFFVTFKNDGLRIQINGTWIYFSSVNGYEWRRYDCRITYTGDPTGTDNFTAHVIDYKGDIQTETATVDVTGINFQIDTLFGYYTSSIKASDSKEWDMRITKNSILESRYDLEGDVQDSSGNGRHGVNHGITFVEM